MRAFRQGIEKASPIPAINRNETFGPACADRVHRRGANSFVAVNGAD
jgi:hypothetical protein